jgi:hypothetical protein
VEHLVASFVVSFVEHEHEDEDEDELVRGSGFPSAR